MAKLKEAEAKAQDRQEPAAGAVLLASASGDSCRRLRAEEEKDEEEAKEDEEIQDTIVETITPQEPVRLCTVLPRTCPCRRLSSRLLTRSV